MTDDLRNAYEKLSACDAMATPNVLKKWADLSPNELMDFRGQLSVLLIDANSKNERGDTQPRVVIRRPLVGMTRLASFAPWNELFVIDSIGVRLQEDLTKEDISELCGIYSRFSSCLCQPPLEGWANENTIQSDEQLAEIANSGKLFKIRRTVYRERRKLPNTAAKRMLRGCAVWSSNMKEIAPKQWIVYEGDVTIAFDTASEQYAQLNDAGGIGAYETLVSLVARLDKEIDPAKYPESHQVN